MRHAKHTCNDCDNQQETSTETKRVPWTNDELQKVKASFDDEIREQNISLSAIRAKVNASEQLKGMSPRQIYDKLKKGLPTELYLIYQEMALSNKRRSKKHGRFYVAGRSLADKECGVGISWRGTTPLKQYKVNFSHCI